MELEKFRIKFLEEATEKINELEEALLLLENDSGNKEIIERVFRSMHSLKGGGAMFGFVKLSEFTHDLENIYDLIRNDKLEISRGLLDVTLASVDHLKTLLNDTELESEDSRKIHNELVAQIKNIIENKENSVDESIGDESLELSKSSEIKTYYIYFEPNNDIFNNGTNPLFLIDELQELGDSKVFSHFNRVPDIDNIDVTKCYVYWEVLLATEEKVNVISDVFIFVEDECKLEISELTDYNVLNNKNAIAEIAEAALEKSDVGLSEMQLIIKKYSETKDVETKDEVVQPVKTTSKKENIISSIRVSSDKLDLMMNLISELVTTQARLTLIADKSSDSNLLSIAENVQKLTRQIRDNAFDIVLVPIDTMTTRFQRLVRDLSNELNKKVILVTEGTDTELDKTIIESLTDPLLHILRNCIDHGIESAEERKKLGKPEQGEILFKAYYSGADVHIKITDDGSGIDSEKIRSLAIEKGLMSKDALLNRKEIFDLIFASGFSTVQNVTDVSGRGVGMDVVKRKLAEVRGEVEIESEVDVGTTITIKLPLTLSIIDGLLVQIAKEHYIIPLSVVNKIYSTEHNNVVNKYNNLIVFDGEQIPFYYLREELKLPESKQLKEQVIIVSYEDKKIGIVVDEIVGEYQAVLKSLGKMFTNQDMISGATILGDGTIALVMDTNRMILNFSKDNYKEKTK